MCGIVGIYNVPEASKITALGIHGLQHRGQEGAGIISYDKEFHSQNAYGLVDHIFSKDKIIKNLQYNIHNNNILGHSDISPYRKFDPGPKFPWKKLAKFDLIYFPVIKKIGVFISPYPCG